MLSRAGGRSDDTGNRKDSSNPAAADALMDGKSAPGYDPVRKVDPTRLFFFLKATVPTHPHAPLLGPDRIRVVSGLCRARGRSNEHGKGCCFRIVNRRR